MNTCCKLTIFHQKDIKKAEKYSLVFFIINLVQTRRLLTKNKRIWKITKKMQRFCLTKNWKM